MGSSLLWTILPSQETEKTASASQAMVILVNKLEPKFPSVVSLSETDLKTIVPKNRPGDTWKLETK